MKLLQDRFKQEDSNNDGVVDKPEFVNFLQVSLPEVLVDYAVSTGP